MGVKKPRWDSTQYSTQQTISIVMVFYWPSLNFTILRI